MQSSEKLEQIFMQVQKPARYTGGELNSVMKDPAKVNIRIAMAFPDLYEIGMSHLGMKLLYGLFNEQEDVWCERVFAPDTDMEALMRANGLKLFGLESRDPVDTFDFLGFTLQYELSFTAILNMLDLAGIPLLSADRGDDCSLVIAGGPILSTSSPWEKGRRSISNCSTFTAGIRRPASSGRRSSGRLRRLKGSMCRRCMRCGITRTVPSPRSRRRTGRPRRCASGLSWTWIKLIIRTVLWYRSSISSTTAQ